MWLFIQLGERGVIPVVSASEAEQKIDLRKLSVHYNGSSTRIEYNSLHFPNAVMF